MYFVDFKNYDRNSDKKLGYKEFDNKGEALNWLYANGYEADCVPAGGNPYNSNMFWNAEEKISAMGLFC